MTEVWIKFYYILHNYTFYKNNCLTLTKNGIGTIFKNLNVGVFSPDIDKEKLSSSF